MVRDRKSTATPAMTDPAQATELLRQKATERGCELFGVAAAGPLERELQELCRWLSEGRHGDMKWLEKEPERRSDPRRVVDNCRSVIVLGVNYLDGPVEEEPPPLDHGRISKYARSRDYHRVFEKMLKKLTREAAEILPGAETRGYVDYGPVLERPWAALAGLGFVGKHTLLIDPRRGSFFFLAILLSTGEFAPTPMDAGMERFDCGDCRRCIDACPTGAITEPWRLDARRCLSYLTIEKQGPTAEEFHPQYAGNVFGCDICQDVCPYNRARAKPRGMLSPLGGGLVSSDVSLVELILRPEEFLASLGETASPLRRAGAESLRRNALIVSGERGGVETFDAISALLLGADLPDWLRDLAKNAQSAIERRHFT